MYLWYESKAGIHGLCIPVDSFDLRCESVTFYHYYQQHIHTDISCIARWAIEPLGIYNPFSDVTSNQAELLNSVLKNLSDWRETHRLHGFGTLLPAKLFSNGNLSRQTDYDVLPALDAVAADYSSRKYCIDS